MHLIFPGHTWILKFGSFSLGDIVDFFGECKRFDLSKYNYSEMLTNPLTGKPIFLAKQINDG